MARDLAEITLDLRELAASDDPEDAHMRADELLLEAIVYLVQMAGLRHTWAETIKDHYEQVPRWCA